jgi:hypothetical protein
MTFSEAIVNACVYSLKKRMNKNPINMLYIGSLLHVDVETVSYFKH